MSKICFVTTSPLIVNFFLVPHLLHLARRYEMSLAVRLPGEVPLRALPGIDVISVNIRREIAPLAEAAALTALTRLFALHCRAFLALFRRPLSLLRLRLLHRLASAFLRWNLICL